uniref:Uncharacterized protein n=1 Tax=Anguilla anguilla TaxID=7936 RepID=A0A0E9UFJ8_ANGAN
MTLACLLALLHKTLSPKNRRSRNSEQINSTMTLNFGLVTVLI